MDTVEIKVISSDATTDIETLSPLERRVIVEKLVDDTELAESITNTIDATIAYNTAVRLPDIPELKIRRIVELAANLRDFAGLITAPIFKNYKRVIAMQKMGGVDSVTIDTPDVNINNADVNNADVNNEDVNNADVNNANANNANANNANANANSEETGVSNTMIGGAPNADVNKANANSEETGVSNTMIGGVVSRRQLTLNRQEPVDASVPRVRFDDVTYGVTPDGSTRMAPIGEEISVYGMQPYPSIIRYSYIVTGRDAMGAFQYIPADGTTLEQFNKCSGDLTQHNQEQCVLDIYRYRVSPEFLVYMFAKIQSLYTSGKKQLSNKDSDSVSSAVSTSSEKTTTSKTAAQKKAAQKAPSDANRSNTTKTIITQTPQTYLETLAGVVFADGTALSDMWRIGLFDLYVSFMLNGKDAAQTKALAATLREREARESLEKNERRRAIAKIYTRNVYSLLIERKLGTKRLAELSKQRDILANLTSQERKLIDLEYVKRERYLREIVENKCPHVKIIKQFRRGRYDKTSREAFDQLSRFVPGGIARNTRDNARNSHVSHDRHNDARGSRNDASVSRIDQKPQQVIQCNACGFDLICPHIIEYANLTFANAPFQAIKSAMYRYIDQLTGQTYYCKVCGEAIAEAETYETATGREDLDIDDELRSAMFSEIVTALRHVDFGSVINTQKMINSIMTGIHEFVFEDEKALLTAKTNSADDIKNKRKLYIAIYVYAYLAHLMLSAKVYNEKSGKSTNANVTFRGFKANQAADYLKYAIKLISFTKNVVINQIPNITSDFIRNKLVDAYRNVAGAGKAVITLSDDTETIIGSILADPIYHWYYRVTSHAMKEGDERAKRMQKLLNIDHPYDAMFKEMKVGEITDAKSVDKIFGDAAKHIHDKPTHDKHSKPTHDKSTHDKSTHDKSTHDKSTHDKSTHDKSTHDKSTHDKSTHGKPATHTIQVDTTDLLRMFLVRVRLMHSVVYSEEKLTPAFQRYKDLMRQLPVTSHIERRPQQSFPTFIPDTPRFPEVSLGQLYDVNGQPHKWNIFVFPQGEYTAAQLDALMMAKTPVDIATHTDTKCGVCGVLRSKTGDIPTAAIMLSLTRITTIDNFFKYFAVRCPEGDLHDFINGACKKCGLQYDTRPIPYFDKYNDRYRPEPDIPITPVTETPSTSDEKYSLKDYSYNFGVLVELATKLKIKPQLLTCMGATEGVRMDEILNTKFIPIEPQSVDDYRIYRLDAYHKMLITCYNQLRYFSGFSRPSVEIKELLEKANYPAHATRALPNLLPDISDNYMERFAYARQHLKPRVIMEYLLEMFAAKCLVVWHVDNKEVANLCQQFVMYIVAKTLRIDELTTKNAEFKWSILFPQQKVEDTYDQNVDQELGEVDIEHPESDDEDEEETPDNISNKFDIDFNKATGEEPDEDDEAHASAKVEGYDELR